MTIQLSKVNTPEDFMVAYKNYSREIIKNTPEPVFTQAYHTNYSRTFTNIAPYTSITSDYGRQDYDSYRQSDRVSHYTPDIIGECMEAYEWNPIVHNVIDLMSDFGSQGIRIVAADKKQERFAQEWSDFVGLSDFANRYLSMLYRAGTVIVKRTDGKVPVKIKKKWITSTASQSIKRQLTESNINSPYTSIETPEVGEDPKNSDIEIIEEKTAKATIPLKWTVHNPLSVIMIGGLLGDFIGKPLFGLRINPQLRTELAQLPQLATTHDEYKYFLNLIPKYVFDSVNSSSLFFPLDQSKTYAYYYKKDDGELWGKPLIKPILRELKLYNKLKLSDMSALDGAISAVRLWRLGSLKEKIVPQQGAMNKVRDMVSKSVGGGVKDIIWGPDLELIETNSTLHQFLSPTKYQQTMSDIYAGLGIPSGMTGNTNSETTTNKFTGMKVLIERLKYGRNLLVKFLNTQLKLVQEAMGFKKQFRVVFDEMVLSDEVAEKQLLLQLWDRDIITTETLRYACNIDEQDIEDFKIRREVRKRGVSMPHKASQFHNPEKDYELKKLAFQSGTVTPSEIGITLHPKKEGEKTPSEYKGENEKKYEPIGSKFEGRPLKSKDKTKRKPRRILPRGASANFKDLYLYAESAREKIDELLTPIYLNMVDKKNIRSLNEKETKILENIKFATLSSISPYSEFTLESLAEINSDELVLNDFYKFFEISVYNYLERYGRSPNTLEKRKLECEAYASVYCE